MLDTVARQAKTLRETAHRPWPLPERDWLQAQTWEQLLFAHWRVEPEQLVPHVPGALGIDAFDGSAWVGITPFRLTGFRLRGLPPAPVLSTFPELNVRTYVTVGGKPGIWFFSLDADSRFAVSAARRAYHLPYHHARMSATRRAGWIEYSHLRDESHAFRGSYRGVGRVSKAKPGSLEHFLAERYCLYATDGDGDVWRGEIHHPPWPLQAAEARIELNTVAPPGIELDGEPLLHYAERQDTVIWSLEAVPA